MCNKNNRTAGVKKYWGQLVFPYSHYLTVYFLGIENG